MIDLLIFGLVNLITNQVICSYSEHLVLIINSKKRVFSWPQKNNYWHVQRLERITTPCIDFAASRE